MYKTNDSFSLGIPDLVIILNGVVYFLEVKRCQRTNGSHVLHHPFSGPQIAVMRQVRQAGGYSYGIVGTATGQAYLLHPSDIPNSGNFNYRYLESNACVVNKIDHIWSTQGVLNL